MTAVSAVMVAIVRWPLGSPHWFVFVKAFLLPCAVIACATLLTVRHVERGGAYSALLISTVAVIFLPCLAWLNGPLADVVTYPLFIGLLAAGISHTAWAMRKAPAGRWVFAVACGGLFGFGYFLVINSRAYGSVLTLELALTGIHQLDTIFHASIANMLVKYGVLSTGLDGLLSTKYHVLSHIWLGCIGLWLGVPTLEAYSIGGQIIAIPMLLFGLSLAIHLFRRPGEGPANGALITLGSLLLLFVADLWGWTSYLVSESYFLAMIMFLLALPLLAEIADSERRHRLSLQVTALGVAGLLILLSKISVGAVLAGGAGFLLWRRMGTTPLGLIKLAAPLLLLVILAIAIISPSARMLLEALEPLGFIREHPRGALPNIAANLVLLYVAFQVWRGGTPQDQRCAEAVAVMAIASVVPVLLINVPGGSGYYFVNVGTWTAIVFVCAYRGAHFEKLFPNPRMPGFVVGALLLVAFATQEKRQSAYRLGALFAEVQARARVVSGESAGAETTTRQRLIELLTPGHPARYALASDMKRTPGWQVKATLLAMGITQSHRAAVFVPPDNVPFWTIAVECRQDPLFVPAILGAPMLKGLNPPALKCPKEPHYGFADYKDASSEPLSDQQLCARAAPWKLDTVLILTAPTTGRKIRCS
ncbi:hypothetical protein [Bradyrhizobium sp. 170]|uniref:hypothetical protein n=1 Tax=Bradyrhizobium sp. 170 TaxID=2782641 RepID=UPI001FFEF58F|nr:hypothetical protein [Bradyrhizobium sp. 170]UPK02095.1 hypothetical protein IVB05_31365 [Bradyrhizobium sp. 170]